MTKRKPPGTSLESWIDEQVRVAREEGAFDNLPGAGKPLPNLDQNYDILSWVRQLVQREQLSILPPSLELLRKVEKELAEIEKLDDEATVRRRVATLGRAEASSCWSSSDERKKHHGQQHCILEQPIRTRLFAPGFLQHP